MRKPMRKPIETRSLTMGIMVGTIAVLCIGATLRHSNQSGRFQLGIGDGQTAYVIDTVSGQVWQKNVHNKEFFAPKAEASKF